MQKLFIRQIAALTTGRMQTIVAFWKTVIVVCFALVIEFYTIYTSYTFYISTYKDMDALTHTLDESKYLVPRTWSKCPHVANELIFKNFLAFKTPLASVYNKHLPKQYQFTLDMFFHRLEDKKLKLGLWIDLTNARNFYPTNKIKERGCKYLKLHHRDGAFPSETEVQTFVEVCRNFIANNPSDIVGVHSIHGFNRTGFFIVSYLVLTNQACLECGLSKFAAARPPGIYKQEYIMELYKRYENVTNVPSAPSRPFWCTDYVILNIKNLSNEHSDAENQNIQQAKKSNHLQSLFFNFSDIPGVTRVLDNEELARIRKRVQTICAWNFPGFPGSQPVHMNMENISCLKKGPYRVSWMTNGAR